VRLKEPSIPKKALKTASKSHHNHYWILGPRPNYWIQPHCWFFTL